MPTLQVGHAVAGVSSVAPRATAVDVLRPPRRSLSTGCTPTRSGTCATTTPRPTPCTARSVAADRNHTNLQQPEQIQPCPRSAAPRVPPARAAGTDSPTPVSNRLRPKPDALGEPGVAASLLQLEGNLRRRRVPVACGWPEAEGSPRAPRGAELTIRHGLDSRGLALVLGLRDSARPGVQPRFRLLADAWRELERSLAAAAVAASGRDNCAQLAGIAFGWSGETHPALRAPLTEHVDRCSRCCTICTPSSARRPRRRDVALRGGVMRCATRFSANSADPTLPAGCGRDAELAPAIPGADGFPARLDPASQGSVNARRVPGAVRAAARPGPGVRHVRSGRRRGLSDAAGDRGGDDRASAGRQRRQFLGNGRVTATAAGALAVLPGRPDAACGTSAPSSVGFTATASGSAFP